MRTTAHGMMMFGLAAAGLALADGPGSINWPPPGGMSATPPPGVSSSVPPGQGFRPYPDYQQAQRFRNPGSRQFRKELIAPPGEDWPKADYYQGDRDVRPERHQGELRPEPMERGEPVEVVPPPSVPIGEVKSPLSDKPERGWRPMKEQQELEAMEESVEPPQPEEKKPLVLRKIEKPVSPLHEPDGKAGSLPAAGSENAGQPSSGESPEPGFHPLPLGQQATAQ
ncbi:hypothetical protein [Thiolapillus sp.]